MVAKDHFRLYCRVVDNERECRGRRAWIKRRVFDIERLIKSTTNVGAYCGCSSRLAFGFCQVSSSQILFFRLQYRNMGVD